jgi:hypothetical protein
MSCGLAQSARETYAGVDPPDAKALESGRGPPVPVCSNMTPGSNTESRDRGRLYLMVPMQRMQSGLNPRLLLLRVKGGRVALEFDHLWAGYRVP